MLAQLSKPERQNKIVARLQSQVTVRILSLAEEFGVSTETIRRDIDELTARGLVSRTYGGAASRSLTDEPGYVQREMSRVGERVRIGALAAELVLPGDVLMIDSGSTTAEFARALGVRRIEVTALTNGVAVARALAANPAAKVILCPGEYSDREQAVYGQETSTFLGGYRASKTFIGAGGITPEGVTDADPNACWIKRAMIERAGRRILLLDSGKFGADLFTIVCPVSRIDDMVTEAAPAADLAGALANGSVRLHIADG